MFDRFAEKNLLDALDDTPVVLIHGSRQCGKTTLTQLVGKKLGYYYLTFDDTNQLNSAKNDPVGFIDNLPEKVIIDEVQRAPEIFTSIKASVDKNRKPGPFILTGSANVLLLPKLSDSLASIQNVSILPKLLQLCASQTARLFNVSDLASPFSVSRPTIKEYITFQEQRQSRGRFLHPRWQVYYWCRSKSVCDHPIKRFQGTH
jgi:hypothetical protein